MPVSYLLVTTADAFQTVLSQLLFKKMLKLTNYSVNVTHFNTEKNKTKTNKKKQWNIFHSNVWF